MQKFRQKLIIYHQYCDDYALDKFTENPRKRLWKNKKHITKQVYLVFILHLTIYLYFTISRTRDLSLPVTAWTADIWQMGMVVICLPGLTWLHIWHWRGLVARDIYIITFSYMLTSSKTNIRFWNSAQDLMHLVHLIHFSSYTQQEI